MYRKNVISFSVENKAKWTEFAKAKGFKNASDLARFALYQYEARYPSKSRRAVQPQASDEKAEAYHGRPEGEDE